MACAYALLVGLSDRCLRVRFVTCLCFAAGLVRRLHFPAMRLVRYLRFASRLVAGLCLAMWLVRGLLPTHGTVLSLCLAAAHVGC